jgi:hypothetical protein
LLVGMITGTYTDGLPTSIENIDFKVNADDKYNLHLVGVTNLTVKGCAFNADGRFLGDPNAVAVQLDTQKTCQDITIDTAALSRDGYYVAIQGRADNLLVKDCDIDELQERHQHPVCLWCGSDPCTNTDISVVAQGVANDTYCVRFGSKSGLAQNLNIAGGVFTVDRNGLTPDADTYFNAVIVRKAASGTLALSQSSIQGGVVNLSETPLTAENNWFGSATGPTSDLNVGGTGDAVTGDVDFSPWLGDGTDTQPEVIGFQPNLTPVYYLPASLAFTQQPGDAALGADLNPQPVVTVYDEIGQIATQFVGTVTLAIGSQPGNGVLTGTLTKPCVAGEVSFTDLAVTLDGGTGFTLAASAASPIAGATSAAFDIANPAPVLDAMDPIFAAAGSGDLTLTLSGSAFVGSSAVKWGAAETVLVPASVTADSMTVTVPAALLTTAGTAAVKVFSPAEGGGTSSDLTFTITATALAPEVWVDDDWTGPANCGVGHVWGYDAFATVQGGLDGAAAGATVSVASGLYTEDIKINRHVTLLGPKADAARNTGSATDWTSATTAGWTADDAEAAGEAVIRSAAVVADGVVDIAEDCHATIKGFVVEARNRTDSANAHLIYADAKNTTLQTITIENNIIGPVTGAGQDGSKGRFGISFNSQSSGNNGLAGVVRGNKILGAEGNGANLFIIGQHYNPSMADYSGMLIESNDVYGANRSGIEIAGGVRGLTIRDNWIAYNGYIWNGSAYVQSAKSQATPDNILYGAGVNLIRTGTICGNYTPENQNAIENLVLSGNTITKNEKSGVYVDAQQRNLSILGNEITDNGRDGIWLDEYGTYNKSKTHHAAYGYIQNAVVNGNRITGAVGAYAAIRVVGKPLNLSISDNDLSGNAVSVVQNDGAGQSWDYIANASGNWWGSADAADRGGNVVAGDRSTTAPGWRSARTRTAAPSASRVTSRPCTWTMAVLRPARPEVFRRVSIWSPRRVARSTSLAGTYNESVALDKPLTLTGPAAGDKPLLVGMITGTYTGGLSMRIENIDFKVNATDKNNLKFTGVKNLTVKGCDFDADERYMTLPQVVAVQLEGACQNITLDACTFHDGYYVTIQSANSVDNLLVKDCLIDDCKSGINIQYASGAGLTVTNSEINVVAQGAVNDTYCVRFGSKSGLAQSLNIAGGVFTVDRNGLTPDADTYFNAVIVRAAASGTLALSQSSIQGGVVNLSETPLTAENNWFGSVTGPTSTLNAGGTGDAVIGSVDFSPWLGDGTDTQPEIIGFQPNLTPVYYLPAGIWFSTEPAGALLGAPLGTQPVITVTNEIGEVATQFNGSVTLAIGNNPGEPVAGELSGTVTLPVANGVAAFSDLAIIKGTGNGYTLVASTEGLPAVTSTAFDIENSTPVLAPIGNQTVDEEALLTFPATATDTAADLVAQTLTFSLSGEVPDGASITTNGVFTWTPTEEQGGADYTFTVVVTDNGTGELSDSETITITVNEVNVAPTLQGVPTTQLSVDEQPAEALTFTATATDQDRPAQTLTFSLVAVEGENYPTGAEIVTTSTGVGTAEGAFSWEPTEEQGGIDLRRGCGGDRQRRTDPGDYATGDDRGQRGQQRAGVGADPAAEREFRPDADLQG